METQLVETKFDLHQHYGSLIGVPGSPTRAAVTPEMDRDSRLEFMDAFDIGAAAIMPGHSYNAARGFADIVAMNDGLHAYGQLAPDRFAAILGTVDPRHGNDCLGEVERLHELGFRGLSWHSRFQGLPMDHPVMFAIAERMNACGMVALCHCAAQGDFEAPWRMRRLAERFPDMPFFALDAMTSPENVEQLFGVAERCPNVSIDMTTTLIGAQGLLWAIERVGAERLVFGSNFYSMSRIGVIDALEAIDQAGLSAKDRAAILGGNARRILGIAAFA